MNKPPLSLLALLSIAPILAGGCTLYANPSACETQMRRAASEAAPAATLSISHVGVGIKGSRVVVEGTLETAAAAPAGASQSPNTADATRSPAKPVTQAAAAECTFDGDKLRAMRWLAPPELARPPATAAADTDG
ncbi:MAG TPA: hypothetical protein VF446_13965 [Trinickia sp.]